MLALFIGTNDLADVLLAELILPFALIELIGCINEQNIIRLLALLEHENADRDARGIEEIGWQADYGIDMAVFQQLGADAFFCTATKEHAMGKDDRHHAFIFEVVEAVEEEGEIGGRFGGKAVAFEAHVVGE